MKRLWLGLVLAASLVAPLSAATLPKKSFCEAAWSINTWWGDIIAAINGC